jgi:hypothetical protein
MDIFSNMNNYQEIGTNKAVFNTILKEEQSFGFRHDNPESSTIKEGTGPAPAAA